MSPAAKKPRLPRRLAWAGGALALPVLALCILWRVPLWAVVPLVAALTVSLWWRQRSVHKILIALSLTLAGMTVVFWGQSFWAPISIHCWIGSHSLVVRASPTFISIHDWCGGMDRRFSPGPLRVIALFMAYPLFALAWGPTAPRHGMVRQARLAPWIALGIAILSFLLFYHAAAQLIGPLVAELSNRFPFLYLLNITAGRVLKVAVAFLLAWRVYLRLRWRLVPDGTPYCQSCGYNLTGNVSGVCPECGASA